MSEPSRIEVPFRWGDMDAYGHVNNVQYLRILEDARVHGFAEWGRDRASIVDEGVVVTRHAIDYLRPLTFRHAPVEVRMWVTAIGGASFDLGYEIADPARVGTQVYAVAETGLATFDLETGRPRRVGEALTAVLRDHLGEPVRFRRTRA